MHRMRSRVSNVPGEGRRGSRSGEAITSPEYAHFADLGPLLERYQVETCVIDGLPETHATREFARAHRETVYMCFFRESQRGEALWTEGVGVL